MSGVPAIPISFGPPEAWCFGWYHAAHTTQAPPRGMGIALCRPVGFEAHCTYETYTQLAEQLAQAGFAVIRFDYHGCGDSSGHDSDPDRVNAWVNSTVLAIHEVKRLGGVPQVALFGMRLGATLAATAASLVGGVDSLVMWAPCVTGRAFARELRTSHASSPSLSATTGSAAPADIQALGYTYTAQTLQDLHTLDCQHPATSPARRVMIVGRDDLPIEGPLPAAYKAMGLDTTYAVLPGYAGIMVEPHDGVVPTATLGLIADWLCAAPVATNAMAIATAASVHSSTPSQPSHCITNGVQETPLSFGPTHTLFGILTQPACSVPLPPPLPAAANSHPDTAILMITVAANHRIGPNRLHVALARSWATAGYASLRFDLAGIGDSRVATGFPGNRLFYSKDTTTHVQSAMDCLVARGYRQFVVMGLCSGAYAAFLTALSDPRVAGQILLNPRRLEEQAGSTLQSAMQSSYKSIHFYKRALLDINVYRRTLRGEVDVKGIARRVTLLAKARLMRMCKRLVRREAVEEDDVLAHLKALSARRTNTLMLIGTEDDGRDYIEFHLGHRGSRLQQTPHMQIIFMESSDHTFTTLDSRQRVITMVQQHLDSMTRST